MQKERDEHEFFVDTNTQLFKSEWNISFMPLWAPPKSIAWQNILTV